MSMSNFTPEKTEYFVTMPIPVLKRLIKNFDSMVAGRMVVFQPVINSYGEFYVIGHNTDAKAEKPNMQVNYFRDSDEWVSVKI